MRLFLLVVFSVFLNSACVSNVQAPIDNTIVDRNTQSSVPVLLISIDGFANDYLTQYPTKNIHKLMQKGVKAQALYPIFPSKTFPNHLSIITGTYPIKHGIIHNKFFNSTLNKTYHLGAGRDDPRWVTAPPLWTIAEQHNIKSAVYFWPESEAKVQGIYPTYNFSYNKKTPNIQRVKQIIDWLKLPKEQQPKFIASYFSIVDTAGHHYGRNSPQLANAIKEIDDLIGVLTDKINQELNGNVNIILVSDHGMVQLNKNSDIAWKSLIADYKDIKIINGQTQLLIYGKNNDTLKTIAQKFKQQAQGKYQVYSADNFPKHWHWSAKNSRIPNLVIDANVPYVFSNSYEYKDTKATHGYDRRKSSHLNAIFIAAGPNFKTNKIMPAFENVDIAPLILKLLKLNKTPQMDGNSKIFTPYIKL